jgi:hypothetical protein
VAESSGSAKGSAAMEAALEILAPTGPEYDGGLSNHGPMAAEALVTLGRHDEVVPWVERYRRQLDTHPSASRRIASSDWREVLGDYSRVGDWIALFRRAFAERPWREELGTWLPRLSPGIIASAFHGVIRTAHAARSLGRQETPARLRELAEGLGYWAASYRELPAAAGRPARGRLPSDAIRDVAAVPEAERGQGFLISDRLQALDSFPPFRSVLNSVDASGDASRFLSDLTETFAGVYLANVPASSVITFIHTVTGPSAVRLLLPHVGSAAGASLLRHAWQGAAAIQAGLGGKLPRTPASSAGAFDRDELVDRAVATGDEHAIKFTEACLREHALNPKPVYLEAARDAVTRLRSPRSRFVTSVPS